MQCYSYMRIIRYLSTLLKSEYYSVQGKQWLSQEKKLASFSLSLCSSLIIFHLEHISSLEIAVNLV